MGLMVSLIKIKMYIFIWYMMKGFNLIGFKKMIDYVNEYVFFINWVYGFGIGILDNYNCLIIIGFFGLGKIIIVV